MANKEIIVKDKVDIVLYTAAVQDIVNKFFDEEGNYTPQFGRANAVGVFFNYFVDADSLKTYFADSDKDIDIDLLLENTDCLALYNEALKGDGTYKLDFCNAYADAIDIANQRKSSFEHVVDSIKRAISAIADEISPLFSDDNLAKLTEIAKDIENGNLSVDSIVEAYGNSQRLKDISNKD